MVVKIGRVTGRLGSKVKGAIQKVRHNNRGQKVAFSSENWDTY